jgi:hypothetical protein
MLSRGKDSIHQRHPHTIVCLYALLLFVLSSCFLRYSPAVCAALLFGVTLLLLALLSCFLRYSPVFVLSSCFSCYSPAFRATSCLCYLLPLCDSPVLRYPLLKTREKSDKNESHKE